MCNTEQLVAFLYDDLSSAERAECEAHLARCAGCREELAGLRGVRQHLTAWAPPEPMLDVRVVRGAPPRPLGWVPAWALAAAASLLLLAGAAAIANVEFRYGADGFVIRTGWAEMADARAGAPVQAPAATAASDHLTRELVALRDRIQELETARGEAAGAQPAAVSAALTPEQLAAVRRLVAESEARQRAERVQQVNQVWEDFNAARASDFVRVHEALGRVQGLTTYQLKQYKDSIDYSLYRASLQR